MAFEIFTRQIVRTYEPRVTITNMGRIALNRGSSEILAKEHTELVLLLWDKETKRCAISPIAKKDPRAYRLRSYGTKGRSAGFSCVTFLNHIKYDWSKTRSFSVEYDASDKLLIFDIPKEYLTGHPQEQNKPLGQIRRKDRVTKGGGQHID